MAQNLAAALWNRMATDPDFLTSPVPPLSECIPALGFALGRERERRAAEASRWRPQLDLPVALKHVAVQRSWRSGQPLDEWLNAVLSRALCNLGESELDELPSGYGDVLPLQRDH